MALLFSSWLSELVLVLAGGLVGLYLWYTRRVTYWSKRGVPQLQPSFPFGDMRDSVLGRRCIGLVMKDIHDKFRGHRFGGLYAFARPTFIVRDPDLIRNILVKDFGTFTDRGLFVDEEKPINKHLFNLTGNKWRRLRVKLTPTFTSGKLKTMFPTIDACAHEMAEVLKDAPRRGEVMEMREIAARYTTDIIASVAFGIECHCQREPEAEFRRWGRELFKPTIMRGFLAALGFFNPALAKRIKFSDGRETITEYFYNMVKETVEYREKNNVTRNDFMQLMIQLKNKGSVDGEKQSKEAADNWKLSLDDVVAQAFVFFLAGFETSSTTMSFALLELSRHPEVQRKAQEEVDAVLQRHGGKMTYEAVNDMHYLHGVVSETLRKYPPLSLLNRECSEEYKVPDSDVVLEKGTPVVISLLGLHMDPEHFPEPERFDPERFSEENKAATHPYAYMPFGEGPRNCIGMRLGLLQTKVGLAYLLSNFSIQPTESTRAAVEFHAKSVILMSTQGILLRLQDRT